MKPIPLVFYKKQQHNYTNLYLTTGQRLFFGYTFQLTIHSIIHASASQSLPQKGGHYKSSALYATAEYIAQGESPNVLRGTTALNKQGNVSDKYRLSNPLRLYNFRRQSISKAVKLLALSQCRGRDTRLEQSEHFLPLSRVGNHYRINHYRIIVGHRECIGRRDHRRIHVGFCSLGFRFTSREGQHGTYK